MEIIKILDDMESGADKALLGAQSKTTINTVEDDDALRVISTDTILRASAVA